VSLLYCVSSVFCFRICFILLLRGPVFLIERRHRLDFPPFPPSSEEEEEAHKEAKRRAEREAEHKAERMLGDRYERPKGSGKAPVDPETTFM
jgi:hypothetical protein